MEDILERDFEDEEIEEPFTFNPELPLWFDLDTLPTFPTDLLLRQHLKLKLPQLRRQIISNSPAKLEEETESAAEVADTDENQAPKSSGTWTRQTEGAMTPSKPDQKSVTVTSSIERARASSNPTIRMGQGDQIHRKTLPDLESTAEVGVKGQMSKKDLKEESVVQETRGDEETKAAAGDKDEEVEDEELMLKEDVTDQEGEMEERDNVEMEDEKEEKFRPIIAPDCYIPNSVIRAIIQPPRPPSPPTPIEWKLKEIAFGDLSTRSEETDYEGHEPFTWASSEESSIHEESPLSSPTPETSRFSFAAWKKREKPEKDTTTDAEKHEKRKLSMKVLGKLILAHPGKSKEREKMVTDKKKKKKGRGINLEGATRKRYGKVGTLDEISHGDGEEEEEEKEEEELGPVESLLQKITNNYWYPKGLKLDILTVVKTLLTLLDDAEDGIYASICRALVEVHDLVGLGGNLLDLIIHKYMRELRSSIFMTRLHSVKTLANLHDDRPAVVLGILNAMADKEEAVRKAAAEALNELAGISTKKAMEDYLARIGILQRPAEDTFEHLAKRLEHASELGDSEWLATASQFLERRQSSLQQAIPVNYDAEMTEEWIEEYFSEQDLYVFKGTKSKPRAPALKKKQRKSLAVSRRRPLPEDIIGEETEGRYDVLPEEEEGCYYGTEEEEEEEESGIEDVSEKMELEEEAAEEPHIQLKMNKHQMMMRAKEAAAEREKAIMQQKAKERMRKHIEEYEQAMKKKRRKTKHLLPYHPLFYRYYTREEASSRDTPRKSRMKVRKVILDQTLSRESRSTQVCNKETTIVTEHGEESERADPVSFHSMSERSRGILTGAYRKSMHLPPGGKILPGQIHDQERQLPEWAGKSEAEGHIRDQDGQLPQWARSEAEGQIRDQDGQLPQWARSEAEAHIRDQDGQLPQWARSEAEGHIRKGIYYQLDRRRWGLKDGELVAEGRGTSCTSKYDTPLEQVGDSGLGESMITGTSQLLTVTSLRGTDTSDIMMEADGSRGTGNLEQNLDLTIRPKSNLTMANVRRHELLSAHEGRKKEEPRIPTSKKTKPAHNWRDFFLLPEIQEKQKEYAALKNLQNAARTFSDHPSKRMMVGTKVAVPGSFVMLSGGSKICSAKDDLQMAQIKQGTITEVSRSEYLPVFGHKKAPDASKKTRSHQAHQQDEIIIKCIPSGVSLTPGDSNQRLLEAVTFRSEVKSRGERGQRDPERKCRTTNYGALQMTWTNMTPRLVERSPAARAIAMETNNIYQGMDQEEVLWLEAERKGWLRTQMLYPSFFRLQELDFIKRQLSRPCRGRKGNLFQWETPMPTVMREEGAECPCNSHEDVSENWQPDNKDVCPATTSLPSIVHSEPAVDDCGPIVPRNSIASSTCEPLTLPKIRVKVKGHQEDAAIGVKIVGQPLKELSSQS